MDAPAGAPQPPPPHPPHPQPPHPHPQPHAPPRARTTRLAASRPQRPGSEPPGPPRFAPRTPGAAHSPSQATAAHAAPLVAVVPPRRDPSHRPATGSPASPAQPSPAQPRSRAAVGRPPEVHRLRLPCAGGRSHSPTPLCTPPAVRPRDALGGARSSVTRAAGRAGAAWRSVLGAPGTPPGWPTPSPGRPRLRPWAAPRPAHSALLPALRGSRPGGAPRAPGAHRAWRRGVGRARCPVVAAGAGAGAGAALGSQGRPAGVGAPKLSAAPGGTAYLAIRPPAPQGPQVRCPWAAGEAGAAAGASAARATRGVSTGPKGDRPGGRGPPAARRRAVGTSGCGRHDSRFLGCRPRLQTPAAGARTSSATGNPGHTPRAGPADPRPEPPPRPGTPAPPRTRPRPPIPTPPRNPAPAPNPDLGPRTPTPPRGARSVAGRLARGARVPHSGDQEERPGGLRPGHGPVTPRPRPHLHPRPSRHLGARLPFGALGRAGVGGGASARGSGCDPPPGGRALRERTPGRRVQDAALGCSTGSPAPGTARAPDPAASWATPTPTPAPPLCAALIPLAVGELSISWHRAVPRLARPAQRGLRRPVFKNLLCFRVLERLVD
uniref:basic proline-rich protein-like n=1 Tax=Nyctereutes procyonoides TaxID=34880 RepID=UPI0024442821|nr:basic proline-rich protein-like [Nyctereutes procyonoides]